MWRVFRAFVVNRIVDRTWPHIGTEAPGKIWYVHDHKRRVFVGVYGSQNRSQTRNTHRNGVQSVMVKAKHHDFMHSSSLLLFFSCILRALLLLIEVARHRTKLNKVRQCRVTTTTTPTTQIFTKALLFCPAENAS